MSRVFGVGETVLDIIFKDSQPVSARAGGSVLNSVVSLGRLGVDVSFISDYGNDDVGMLIDKFLSDNQVNTDYITRMENNKSALALAFLNENNDANYSFYKDYPEQRQINTNIDFEEDDILLFGSIFSVSKNSRASLLELLSKANDSRSTIIYDPNFRKPHIKDLPEFLPLIKENISFADIVRGSDEDFYHIFGANSAEQAYQHINEAGCTNLIYTSNKEEVAILASGVKLWMDVPQIEPISTIGAGDNFNAGIIWTLVREELNKRDIEHLPENIWRRIGESGISFSSEVCMNMENYISIEFAAKKLGE